MAALPTISETAGPDLSSFGNHDTPNHVTGRSQYVDDIPVPAGTLYLKIFDASIAHGTITSLDYKEAEEVEGVVKIISFKDIPGENQIGGIIPDEPLLAEKEIHFWGQPILIVAAETEEAAEVALHKIKVEYDVLPAITDPREAWQKGQLLSASRKFEMGEVDKAFPDCAYVYEGQSFTNGQEHLYLETQGAIAVPAEHGSMKVYSSTQGPTAVQRTIARVLGTGMNHVEVDVTRLGGGFGGKEDQASAWAAMAALAAFILNRPAKCILHRMEDMRMTGKRNPYAADFKIGLDKDLKIRAFEAIFFQNGGAAADLSPAILERTLFHCTNSYFVPHVRATAHSCKTHLPPNTAFRGFGGPQGMFVIEAAIDLAAKKLGVPAWEIQRKNLLEDGSEFPYGQVVQECEAGPCWDNAARLFDLQGILEKADTFNRANRLLKKGVSVMPVCFGISFTNTMMNNARALVHVYSDGSVGVSTGAVEMGQGVNAKMIQVAASAFGLPPEKIKLETTNTSRVANTSPSAASSTADLNGKALQDACRQILERLRPLAAEMLQHNDSEDISFENEMVFAKEKSAGLTWQKLIQQAFFLRINLSAKGHYATPVIHYDKAKEKGHPFAYHVYGTAITEVTVDCIRGTYEVDAVQIVHDFGSSMNRPVDLGQIEGGLVQGIGWMTLEEVVYNESGKLLSNALSTYKIPDVYSVPKEIRVEFLNTDKPNLAILKSKAVGEPPLMYGIGAFFAIRNAVLAFNPASEMPISAPITPEKVLMGLYGKMEAQAAAGASSFPENG
jgi:xanthine dehydrogenase large subunit